MSTNMKCAHPSQPPLPSPPELESVGVSWLASVGSFVEAMCGSGPVVPLDGTLCLAIVNDQGKVRLTE